MSHVSGEAAAQGVFGFDRVGHGVEGGGHLAELVGRVVRQALRALAGGERARRGGERAHRGGHPAGEEDPDERSHQGGADPREEQEPLHRGPERLVQSRRPGRGQADDGGADPGPGHHHRDPHGGTERGGPHHGPAHGPHGATRPGGRGPHELAVGVEDTDLFPGHGGERVHQAQRARVPAALRPIRGPERGHHLALAGTLLGRDVARKAGPEGHVDRHRDEHGGPDAHRYHCEGEAQRERSTHRASHRACSRSRRRWPQSGGGEGRRRACGAGSSRAR